MALDAPPMRSAPARLGLARRHAGLAVCAGVVALVAVVGIHEARRPLPPRTASVLATEPIAPPAPATAAAVTAPVVTTPVVTTPVVTTPVATAPVATTAAVPAVTSPEPVVAVTAATAPERVFTLGTLCWPLGASARTAAGAPIMCTRLDAAGVAYADGHARWRRS